MPTFSSSEDVAAVAIVAPSPYWGRSCQLPKTHGACLLVQRALKPQGNSEADSAERTRPSAPGVSGSFGRPMRPWIKEQSAGFTCALPHIRVKNIAAVAWWPDASAARKRALLNVTPYPVAATTPLPKQGPKHYACPASHRPQLHAYNCLILAWCGDCLRVHLQTQHAW